LDLTGLVNDLNYSGMKDYRHGKLQCTPDSTGITYNCVIWQMLSPTEWDLKCFGDIGNNGVIRMKADSEDGDPCGIKDATG